MKGTNILVSAEPMGRFEECIISGTPSPGVCMELVPGIAAISGRMTYRVVSRASGAAGPVVVLLEDRLQGLLPTSAYVNGTRGFLYWPLAGDELNMLIDDEAGTGSAEDTAVGDLLGIETATGMLIQDNSFTQKAFVAMEARHGFIQAAALVWVKRT